MKKFLSALALLVGLTGAATAEPLTPRAAAELLSPSVVQLRRGITTSPSCTATKIGDRTYLTARHCTTGLPNNLKIYAKGEGSGKVEAVYTPIAKKDLPNKNKRAVSDWSVLFTDKSLTGVPSLPIACTTEEEIYQGQPVAYMGFGVPLTKGFFSGYVVTVDGPRKSSSPRSNFDFSVDMKVSGGASGSALISMDTGNIIGVVSEFVPSDRGIIHALGVQNIAGLACDNPFLNSVMTGYERHSEVDVPSEEVKKEVFVSPEIPVYNKELFGL